MNDATKRTKRPITAERIFDIMLDIRLRSRRQAGDSISQVLKDHNFDQALSAALNKVDFLILKGREYVYNDSITSTIISMEHATKALDAYREIKTPPAPEPAPAVDLFSEDKLPTLKLKFPAAENAEEILRLLRMNAATLAEINKRLTRLETKTHSQGDTVEKLASDLKLAIYQPENMRVIQTRNAVNA